MLIFTLSSRKSKNDRGNSCLIDIKELQKLNKPENIAVTRRGHKRLVERIITIADIVRTIEMGEIIEQYEDDNPFPSCLILGKTVGNKPIHIVASHDTEYIYLITAYYPDVEKWEEDLKTRKERK